MTVFLFLKSQHYSAYMVSSPPTSSVTDLYATTASASIESLPPRSTEVSGIPDAAVTDGSAKSVQIKSVKMVTFDRVNFFVWCAQVTAILRSYGLIDYVENPANVRVLPQLDRQDQLVLGWLLSSISPEVLPQVAAFTTASEVWSTLLQLYSSSSKTWNLFLRREFQALQKGGSSMQEYIVRSNCMIDALATADEKLQQGDIILTVLGGLGPEYDAFVTSVTTQFDPSMSFVDLQALLLDKIFDYPRHSASSHLSTPWRSLGLLITNSHPVRSAGEKGTTV